MAKKIVTTIFPLGFIFLLGCIATHPNDVTSTYVSPLQYERYDCDQIAMEMERVSRQASEAFGVVKQKRAKNSRIMSAGLVLWLPVMLVAKGDGPEVAEFARLKGELDTLEQIAIQKKCDPSLLPEIPEFKVPEEEMSNHQKRIKKGR